MQFDDIYRVSPKRQEVTESEINAFEQKWKIKLPEDFQTFLKQFGPGIFCHFLNIFAPPKMSKDHELYLKIMQEAPVFY